MWRASLVTQQKRGMVGQEEDPHAHPADSVTTDSAGLEKAKEFTWLSLCGARVPQPPAPEAEAWSTMLIVPHQDEEFIRMTGRRASRHACACLQK